MIEHAPNALYDREAEAQAARHLGAFVEAMEFAEDDLLLRRGNTETGVVDVDAQVAAPQPAAKQHPALRRLFDGVGAEFRKQPPQQPPVGADGERARHVLEIEALLA